MVFLLLVPVIAKCATPRVSNSQPFTPTGILIDHRRACDPLHQQQHHLPPPQTHMPDKRARPPPHGHPCPLPPTHLCQPVECAHQPQPNGEVAWCGHQACRTQQQLCGGVHQGLQGALGGSSSQHLHPQLKTQQRLQGRKRKQ